MSLDGANVNEPLLLRPQFSGGECGPGLQVENLRSAGQSCCKGRRWNLPAARVRTARARILLLQDAAEGGVEVALALPGLEALALAGAKAAAARHGVTVERVQIALQGRGERALDVVVQVEAKKLFLSAVVRISGSITIDEQLVARLKVGTGDGTLGSLACGRHPHLAQLNGREFRRWRCR